MKGGSPEVLAVVKDLFFVARTRETARLAGVPLVIARTVDEVETSVDGPRLLLLDLTGGFDYARIFDAAERAGVPVLAFTTHALARETQPWHARCARVVTKETLTRSEEHTSELQSPCNLVCRLLLEKKKTIPTKFYILVRHHPYPQYLF